MRAKWVIPSALVASAWCSVALAGDLYAIRDDDNALVKIDTQTLQYSVVGNTGIPTGDFGDLAYDRRTGTMYWIAGRGNNSLYTINLQSGQATLVGAHGVPDLFALGYDSLNNKLYAQSTNQNVYTLNTSNGAATPIGANNVYPGGYDYNPVSDVLYFLQAGGGGVYSVNRSNGAATLIASPGNTNDCDIAYDDDLDVYWAIDYSGNLFQYTPGWARTTPLTGLGPHAACAYAAAAGGVCHYTIKKSKASGGCQTCPPRGDDIATQSRCEDISDCRKKLKTTINCPNGPGACKIKGKRSSCT